ncbi:MAG: hypothetical protein QXV17_12950 [Candidatus Micrarchaeaceae archaeon]
MVRDVINGIQKQVVIDLLVNLKDPVDSLSKALLDQYTLNRNLEKLKEKTSNVNNYQISDLITELERIFIDATHQADKIASVFYLAYPRDGAIYPGMLMSLNELIAGAIELYKDLQSALLLSKVLCEHHQVCDGAPGGLSENLKRLSENARTVADLVIEAYIPQ